MSINEIYAELPALSPEERRNLCRKIIELEAEQEDILFCEESARVGFAMLDELEGEAADHGRGQSRGNLDS
jgi:hypothetical protein